MSGKNELLPCPFCGGRGEIQRYGNSTISTIYQCIDCGCAVETSEECNYGALWNVRHAPPGYKLVPVEPNIEMLITAGISAPRYKAMLDAAT